MQFEFAWILILNLMLFRDASLKEDLENSTSDKTNPARVVLKFVTSSKRLSSSSLLQPFQLWQIFFQDGERRGLLVAFAREREGRKAPQGDGSQFRLHPLQSGRS